MRRRALLRGFTYLVNFLFSYGFHSILSVLPHESATIDALSIDMFTLNGALNMLTYMAWMWNSKRLATNATTESAALEALIIDQYFDLDLGGDPLSQEARQEAALSVAALHD